MANALNELAYLKNLWAGGNSGQQSWASSQADQYYKQLDPATASKVRDMDNTQLDAFIKAQQVQQAKPATSRTITPTLTPTTTTVSSGPISVGSGSASKPTTSSTNSGIAAPTKPASMISSGPVPVGSGSGGIPSVPKPAAGPTTASSGPVSVPASLPTTPAAPAAPATGAGQFTKQADGSITGQFTPEQMAIINNLPDGGSKSAYIQSIMGTPGATIPATGGGAAPAPATTPGKLTFNGQNYDYNPTNYTKPDWLDHMDENTQMAVFKQDRNLGILELNRAKNVYNDASAKGDTPTAQAAHAWAVKIRSALGIKEDDATYGAVDPQNPTPDATTPPVVDPTKNAQDLTSSLLKQFQDTIDAMSNTNNAKWKQDQDLAKQQAAQLFKQKTDSYNNLISSLKSGQQNELSSMQNDVESERMNIEDKTFQNWLAARQEAASRGLGSSGIASDANTRLLLARQKDMAGMYNTKMKGVNDINHRYDSKLMDANTQLANLSQSELEQKAFADLYKTGSGQLTEQAKLFAGLLGKSMGYTYTKPADALKYDSDLKKIGFNYDKLDSEEKRFYDKLDSTDAYNYAKLSQDYNLKMTDIMGQDANGNPTLEAKSLMETMRHNQSSEHIAAAHNAAEEFIGRMNAANGAENARLRGKELDETINTHIAQTKLEADKLENTNLNQQAQDVLSVARSSQSKMNSLVKQKADYMDTYKTDTSKIDQTKIAEFDRSIKIAADDIDAATNSVMFMRKLKDPSAQPFNGGYTSNSGGR
jgi:hypothetical protein